MVDSSRGFTLIETLFVLSIFMLLVSFSLNLYPHYIKTMELKHFVSQFEEDLYFTQAYAMSHERYTSLYMNDQNYSVYTLSDQNILQRTVPKNIAFARGTLDLRITFNRMGTAIKSGVIYIQSDQEKYKVTVYIGKGRFKIEKV